MGLTVLSAPSARRQRSRQQLLEIIRNHPGGVTRSYLSALTGLSRSAVAEGVQDLLPGGLVVEQREHGRGLNRSRGRPSSLLVPAAPSGAVVGIDLGHTHISVALARTDGELLAEQRESFDVDNRAEAAVDDAARLVETLVTHSGLTMADVLGVAAGIPCPLDPVSGRTRPLGDHPTWSDFDVREELSRRLGRQVRVANDAEMGAHGERRFGAARGCRDFLYVKASHGLGAGLVLNGEVYRGATGAAGEIGHIQLPGAQGLCRCGNRGCLETVVSIDALRHQLEELHLPGLPSSSDGPLTSLGANPVAARIVTEGGRVLGHVLADLCNCLNPAAIVIGGELGTAGQPLLEGVRESIHHYALSASAHAVDIRTAQLGLRSELMGAVSQAIEHALIQA
jgi:predicted NBD/HSP70 family sugar kinase/biotin operon repressor